MRYLQIHVVCDSQIKTQSARLQRNEHDPRIDTVQQKIAGRRGADQPTRLLALALCLALALALLRATRGEIIILVVNEVVIIALMLVAQHEVTIGVVIDRSIEDDGLSGMDTARPLG